MTRGEREGGQRGKEWEQSSQGTCIKGLWTKSKGGRIECGKWGMGRAVESNGGKMGTTVSEQQ